MIKNNDKLTLTMNLIIYIVLSIANINMDVFRISTLIYYANYFILGLVVINYYDFIKDKLNIHIELVSILSTFYILIIPVIVNGDIFMSMLMLISLSYNFIEGQNSEIFRWDIT